MSHTCADRPNLPCLACCNNDQMLYATQWDIWKQELMQGNEKISMPDIQVLHGNNTYIVRLEAGEIHILIPALSMSAYLGDSYLDAGQRRTVINLALDSLMLPNEQKKWVDRVTNDDIELD